MAQYLHRTSKIQSLRKERFSVKFMEDLETLIGAIAVEICQRHIKVGLSVACNGCKTHDCFFHRKGTLLGNSTPVWPFSFMMHFLCWIGGLCLLSLRPTLRRY